MEAGEVGQNPLVGEEQPGFLGRMLKVSSVMCQLIRRDNCQLRSEGESCRGGVGGGPPQLLVCRSLGSKESSLCLGLERKKRK